MRFFAKYWWLFLIITILLMIIQILVNSYSRSFDVSLRALYALIDLLDILSLLSIVALVISWVALIKAKMWWQGIVSFVISIVATCILFIPYVFSAQIVPDRFGKTHKIPEGMEYCIPLDGYSDSAAIIDSLDKSTWLQIKSDLQGGLYEYVFYCDALPSGEIYLRCYEATKNVRLSPKQIEERSTVTIDSTFCFSRLVSNQSFTIYEGDFDDYYVARIEVWHRDAVTKKERKLLEKIYRVEGWQH